jgi:hypothetical protein
MKSSNSIDCVDVFFTIGCDLCLYRQQDVALRVGYNQIFPNQTKSQILLGLYLF